MLSQESFTFSKGIEKKPIPLARATESSVAGDGSVYHSNKYNTCVYYKYKLILHKLTLVSILLYSNLLGYVISLAYSFGSSLGVIGWTEQKLR